MATEMYPGSLNQHEYASLVKRAEEANMGRCIYGEAVFYRPDNSAFGPGHIYSETGRAEFRISKCCEYHFDEMFKEED